MALVGDRQAPEPGSSATLLIDDQRIFIAPDYDLPRLIRELTAAIDRGGAFVHVTGRYGHEFDILVTPTTHIVLQHEAVQVDVPEVDEPWAPGADLEY